MDLDARPYRSFLTVAETGSFSRAADVLNVSQPALSAQIKEFERRLGFSLFHRSSRRIALTPEGRLFIDRARRLVTETEWANQAAKDIRTNRLRIGAAHHTADIPERNHLIDRFQLVEPDVPMRVLRRSPPQVLADLRSGDIDVAILLECCDSGVVADDGLNLTRWVVAARPLRLWLPVEHPLASEPVIPEAALRDLPVAMVDRSHGVPIAEQIARLLSRAGASPYALPEGDARSLLRQSSMLRRCTVDLGWISSADDSMRSCAVAGWTAQTLLTVLAADGERRDGANRLLSFLESSLAAGSATPGPRRAAI